MTNGPADLQPICRRCRRRHRLDLPCWAGRLVTRSRVATFHTFGTVCWLCGEEGADTVDHVISRAVGGTDELENLRPAHAFCNTGRGAGAVRAAPHRAAHQGGTPAPLDEQAPLW